MYIRLSVRIKAYHYGHDGAIILDFNLRQTVFGVTFSYAYPFVAEDSDHWRTSRHGDSYENMFRESWRYLQQIGYRPTPTKAVYLATYEAYVGGGHGYTHWAMLDYCIWLYLTHPRLRAL